MFFYDIVFPDSWRLPVVHSAVLLPRAGKGFIFLAAAVLGNLAVPCSWATESVSVASGQDRPVSAIDDVPDEAAVHELDIRGMDILDVLEMLSKKTGLNIIAGKDVSGKVSIYLKEVKLKDVLRIILDANGLAYRFDRGVVRVMPADEYAARTGKKFDDPIHTRVVRLWYADVAAVTAVLNQVKGPQGRIVAEPSSKTLILMDTPGKLAAMEDLILRTDVPTVTRVFDLRYASAKDLAGQLKGALTPGVGRVRFDVRSGKVVVTDTPRTVRQIAALVKAFDVRDRQVRIEAKIVQIILNDEHKLGVDWQAVLKGYHGLEFTNRFDISARSDKIGTLSIGTLAEDDYTFLIQALETQGTTRILSSPSITAVDGREAKILVGSTEPYVTTTTTTPSSGATITAEAVNFIQVGVKLYVTPAVHKDGFVTMKIHPEVSSVTRTIATSTGNVIPVVETSEAETTVVAKNGATIVIGGLIKDERMDTVNRVPLLGSLPLVGRAFQNSDRTSRKTEIVILLTPTIVVGDQPFPEKTNTGEPTALRRTGR